MRSARVAEWILSLVTSPDRAAATVGDLMEAANRYGAVWFWTGVLRTAFSTLWQDFAGAPARMMGLAFRGFLMQFAYLLGFALVLVIGGGIVGLFAGLYWNPTTPTAGLLSPPIEPLAGTLGVAISLLASFQIGRWLARRSPGRELAPVVAFTILGFAISSVGGMVFDREDNLSRFILSLILGLAWNILFQIPAFAGAAWVRRKQITR